MNSSNIKKLELLKSNLIKRRNEILDNSLMFSLSSSLKKELKEIDATLDHLDLKIDLIENSHKIILIELCETVNKIKKKLLILQKYLKEGKRL